MSMDKDPGDYYRRKGDTAHLLSEAIWRLRQLKQYESHVSVKYQDIIDFLEKRLEMARYVGD